jgi:hypothetical protein
MGLELHLETVYFPEFLWHPHIDTGLTSEQLTNEAGLSNDSDMDNIFIYVAEMLQNRHKLLGSHRTGTTIMAQ